MIFGIGFDIVAVTRMQADLDRYGDRFARKLLNETEYPEYAAAVQKAHHLAKRFAVKEALVKAMGTGFRNGITLKDISITHQTSGQPGIACHGTLQEIMDARAITNCHLTLSDERDYACACVILER